MQLWGSELYCSGSYEFLSWELLPSASNSILCENWGVIWTGKMYTISHLTSGNIEGRGKLRVWFLNGSYCQMPGYMYSNCTERLKKKKIPGHHLEKFLSYLIGQKLGGQSIFWKVFPSCVVPWLVGEDNSENALVGECASSQSMACSSSSRVRKHFGSSQRETFKHFVYLYFINLKWNIPPSHLSYFEVHFYLL